MFNFVQSDVSSFPFTLNQKSTSKSRIALLKGEDNKINLNLIVESPMAKNTINGLLVSNNANSPLSAKAVKRSDLPPHLKRRSYELDSEDEVLPRMRAFGHLHGPIQKTRKMTYTNYAVNL